MANGYRSNSRAMGTTRPAMRGRTTRNAGNGMSTRRRLRPGGPGWRGAGRPRPAAQRRNGGGFKAAGDSLGSMQTAGHRFVTHKMVSDVRSHKSQMTLRGINIPGGHLKM